MRIIYYVVGDMGVTVNSTPGNILRAQYSTVFLIKIASDEWLLIGDITN